MHEGSVATRALYEAAGTCLNQLQVQLPVLDLPRSVGCDQPILVVGEHNVSDCSLVRLALHNPA